MGKANQYIFEFTEVTTALIKQQGLHEGIWSLQVNFGISAINIDTPANPGKVLPAAIVPIRQLCLVKTDKESNLAIDAAKVNPKPVKADTEMQDVAEI